MADATIKIDADTASAQPKLDKLRQTASKTADEYSRGGRAIRDQGEAAKRAKSDIDQMAKGYLKSLIGITAIVAMTKQLINANEQVRSATLARTEGKQNVAITAGVGIGALSQMGAIKGGDGDALLQQVMNATDREGSAGLLKSLSDKATKDRRFRSRLNSDSLRHALSAKESGVFDDAQIEEYLSKGKRFDIGERLSALPEDARNALSAKRASIAASQATEPTLSKSEQVLDANTKRQTDQSALLTLMSNVGLAPLIRSGARAKTGTADKGFYDFGVTGPDPSAKGPQAVVVTNQPQPRPQMSGANQSEK
jgi:hypothetical protein